MDAQHPELVATDAVQTVLEQRGLRARYTAFGFCHESIGRFTGQWLERRTNAYLLGAGHRTYLPSAQRFVCPDQLSPFGKGGINAYAYCEAEPVNRLDRTGQFASALIRIFDEFTHVGVQAVAQQTVNIGSFFSLKTSTTIVAQAAPSEYRLLVKALSPTAAAARTPLGISYVARHSSGLLQAYGSATPTGAVLAKNASSQFAEAFPLGTANAQVLGVERPVKVYLDRHFVANTFRQFRDHWR